ncbi:MAG: hypothetical protein LR015_06255 [Verrucomicrobia bacterium]|nr:hypothetical protein [Verrucomicrobiota bacterium]
MMNAMIYLEKLNELNAAFSGKLWLVALTAGLLILVAASEWSSNVSKGN